MFSTNITFTIYDILSHIIPGSAFLLLIHVFYPLPYNDGTITVTYFLVSGYLIGHIFNIFSSLLIKFLESKTFVGKIKRQSNPVLKKELSIQIQKKYLPSLKNLKTSNDNLAHWQVADVIALLSGYDERITLLARGSLYRSLMSLVFVSYLFFVYESVFHSWVELILWGLVALALIYIFYDRCNWYETIKKNQVYAAALVKIKEKK